MGGMDINPSPIRIIVLTVDINHILTCVVMDVQITSLTVRMKATVFAIKQL